jgi:hypothetical protein
MLPTAVALTVISTADAGESAATQSIIANMAGRLVISLHRPNVRVAHPRIPMVRSYLNLESSPR